MPATNVVQMPDRRRGPRSDDAMAQIMKACLENEARVRCAVEAIKTGNEDEALRVLGEALELVPDIWALRAEFTLRLRTELEELRAAIQKRPQ